MSPHMAHPQRVVHGICNIYVHGIQFLMAFCPMPSFGQHDHHIPTKDLINMEIEAMETLMTPMQRL